MTVLPFNGSRHITGLDCVLTASMLVKGIITLVVNPSVLGIPYLAGSQKITLDKKRVITLVLQKYMSDLSWSVLNSKWAPEVNCPLQSN